MPTPATVNTAAPREISPWDLAGWVFLCGVGITLVGVVLGVVAVGFGYYLTPLDQRFTHPRHELYGPGGVVGVLLGIAGAALLSVVALYSVHKWVPALRRFGTNPFWMRFHMLCGLLGPVFIVLHSGVKLPALDFTGVLFWDMVLVAVSGFFGRYLFGYFPGSAAGLRVDLEAAQRTLTALRAQLVAETRATGDEHVGQALKLARDVHLEPTTLRELVALDADVRRRAELVRDLLYRAGLPEDVRVRAEQTLLLHLKTRRNLAGFDVARRLLRYWNLFHQPLALAMYLMAGVHIASSVLFGGVIATLTGA